MSDHLCEKGVSIKRMNNSKGIKNAHSGDYQNDCSGYLIDKKQIADVVSFLDFGDYIGDHKPP